MPDSDLEHQTLYFLAQLDTLEPTDAEGDVMGANEDGSELHHTEQNLLRLDLGQSNEEAQVTIALDCSLGRLSGAGIFERSLSGRERLSFLFWGTLGNAVLLVFSLLGTTARAPEQPLEISRPGGNYTSPAHQSSRVRASPFLVFFFNHILNCL